MRGWATVHELQSGRETGTASTHAHTHRSHCISVLGEHGTELCQNEHSGKVRSLLALLLSLVRDIMGADSGPLWHLDHTKG